MTGHIDICGRLQGFLTGEIVADGVAVGLDDDLAELGVDSFALMELILFIEREYGVVMPLERLTPENTRSVRALGQVVTSIVGT